MLVLMLPRVSSRVFGFPVASPCLWGQLQKFSFLEVSKEVVVTCCFAWQAWPFVTFQLVCTILLRRFHTMSCSFRGRRSTLDVSIVILRGNRSTLEVLCYVYSRMRSKGSRLTLRVWGLRVCSLDVAFTSATVRNCSQPFV